MTKLSDTQTIILSRAAQNEGRIALPLPESLRGGAAAKVVGTMVAKGFLEEVDADMRKGGPVWRETGDGHGVTLIATDAGLAAIGIDTDPAPKVRTQREGTKQAALIAMLRAPNGATIRVSLPPWSSASAPPATTPANMSMSPTRCPSANTPPGPKRSARASSPPAPCAPAH